MHVAEILETLKDLQPQAKVTLSQLAKAAKSMGFGDREEYDDNQAQALIEHFATVQDAPQSQSYGAPHLPTQPPTAEQSSGLISGLARVADGINSGVDQLLLQRDRFVEDTAHLVAHEIASTPYAIESRVGELLGEIGIVADAGVIFPGISRASRVLAEPMQRQSRVEKRSLKAADYLMLTASCAPH